MAQADHPAVRRPRRGTSSDCASRSKRARACGGPSRTRRLLRLSARTWTVAALFPAAGVTLRSRHLGDFRDPGMAHVVDAVVMFAGPVEAAHDRLDALDVGAAVADDQRVGRRYGGQMAMGRDQRPDHRDQFRHRGLLRLDHPRLQAARPIADGRLRGVLACLHVRHDTRLVALRQHRVAVGGEHRKEQLVDLRQAEPRLGYHRDPPFTRGSTTKVWPLMLDTCSMKSPISASFMLIVHCSSSCAAAVSAGAGWTGGARPRTASDRTRNSGDRRWAERVLQRGMGGFCPFGFGEIQTFFITLVAQHHMVAMNRQQHGAGAHFGARQEALRAPGHRDPAPPSGPRDAPGSRPAGAIADARPPSRRAATERHRTSRLTPRAGPLKGWLAAPGPLRRAIPPARGAASASGWPGWR